MLLAASGLVAACGGGGDEAAPTTTTSTTTTSTTTTTVPVGPSSHLTGLPVEEDVLARPVVAVKYDNVQGKSTPQVGVGAADVVYEITVEGSVTRFLALFQSQDAAPIGPVRSARGSEIGLLEELDQPIFTWHGANARLARDVRSSAIIPRSIDDVPQLFYRERSRPAPYNSFAEGTEAIRATAPEASGPDADVLPFGDPDEPASPLAQPASRLELVFPVAFSGSASRGAVAKVFEWDEADGLWRRSQGGRPHVDGDGNQLSVANVIVRFTQAVDSGTTDQAGSRVPTAVVTGEGEAWIFTRGTIVAGRWSKPDSTTPATYTDTEGNPVLLAPGKTWIAMPYGGGSSWS